MKTLEQLFLHYFPDKDPAVLIAEIHKANAERKEICQKQLQKYENEKQAKKLAEKEAENAKNKKRK